MCDSHDRSGSLLTGIVLGAAIGAGLTFLFGTKKGKEVREKVREQYPEVFDKIDEALEGLEEKVEGLEGEGKEVVREKVASLGKAVESTRRFLKSGRKL